MLTILADVKTDFDFSQLVYIIKLVGGFIFDVAPVLIILSYIATAAIWVLAGSSKRMVELARDQFKRTTVALIVILSYWIIRNFIMGGAMGGNFGIN